MCVCGVWNVTWQGRAAACGGSISWTHGSIGGPSAARRRLGSWRLRRLTGTDGRPSLASSQGGRTTRSRTIGTSSWQDNAEKRIHTRRDLRHPYRPHLLHRRRRHHRIITIITIWIIWPTIWIIWPSLALIMVQPQLIIQIVTITTPHSSLSPIVCPNM